MKDILKIYEQILITFFKIFIKYPMLHCNEHGEQTLTAKYFVMLFFLNIQKSNRPLEKPAFTTKVFGEISGIPRNTNSGLSFNRLIFRIKLTPLVLKIK